MTQDPSTTKEAIRTQLEAWLTEKESKSLRIGETKTGYVLACLGNVVFLPYDKVKIIYRKRDLMPALVDQLVGRKPE